MDNKSDHDEAREKFYWAVCDELEQAGCGPTEAMAIAQNLCEWRKTRNYEHITSAKNIMLKEHVKLTRTVEYILAEGDAWLRDGKAKVGKQLAKERVLENAYYRMANYMYKRENMSLAQAAHYAATEFMGVYQASTLEKKYGENFKGSAAEDALHRCIDEWRSGHYDKWTAHIEQLTLDPKLKGSRR